MVVKFNFLCVVIKIQHILTGNKTKCENIFRGWVGNHFYLMLYLINKSGQRDWFLLIVLKSGNQLEIWEKLDNNLSFHRIVLEFASRFYWILMKKIDIVFIILASIHFSNELNFLHLGLQIFIEKKIWIIQD